MGKAFDEIYLKSNFQSWKIFCKVFEQSCLEASEVPQAAVQSATEKAFIYNKQSWIIHKKIFLDAFEKSEITCCELFNKTRYSNTYKKFIQYSYLVS